MLLAQPLTVSHYRFITPPNKGHLMVTDNRRKLAGNISRERKCLFFLALQFIISNATYACDYSQYHEWSLGKLHNINVPPSLLAAVSASALHINVHQELSSTHCYATPL